MDDLTGASPEAARPPVAEPPAPRQPDPRRHIFANTVSSYLRDIIEAVLFVILTPFLIDALGQEGYGLWNLVWAVVSVLALLDFGFGPSVVKFVAGARGRNDPDGHRRTVATLFWIYVAQMALALVAVGGLTAFTGDLFDLPPQHIDAARFSLLALGVSAAVQMPLGLFRGVFIGNQQQRIPNWYKTGGTVLYFAATLAVLPFYTDLVTLSIINAVAMALPMLAMLVHAKVTVPDVSLRLRDFDRAQVRELLSYSFYFMLVAISFLIATRVDAFVIQWALDLRAIAIYALAMRLTGKAMQFGVQLSRTLTPVVAELDGAGDEARLREVWLRGSKIGNALAAPLLVGVAALGYPLIVHWTSEEFADSVPVLQLLMFSSMLTIVHANSHNLLSMRGEQRPLAIASMIGQGLNLGLSLLFVKPFGLIGVASATVIAMLVLNAGIILGRVVKQQKTTRLHFYRKTLLPCVVPSLAMGLSLWGYQELRPIGSLAETAVVAVVGVLVFWAFFWAFGMDPGERGWVRERLGRRFRRLRGKR